MGFSSLEACAMPWHTWNVRRCTLDALVIPATRRSIIICCPREYCAARSKTRIWSSVWNPGPLLLTVRQPRGRPGSSFKNIYAKDSTNRAEHNSGNFGFRVHFCCAHFHLGEWLPSTAAPKAFRLGVCQWLPTISFVWMCAPALETIH